MSIYSKLSLFAPLYFFFMPSTARAYIDPGTTQSIFGMIAPLLSLAAVFLALLLKPFKSAFTAIFGKKNPDENSEDQTNDTANKG